MITDVFKVNYDDIEYFILIINNDEYICDRFRNSITSKGKMIIIYDLNMFKDNILKELPREKITLTKLLEIFNVEYDLYFKDISSGKVLYKLDYFKFKRKSKLNRIIC